MRNRWGVLKIFQIRTIWPELSMYMYLLKTPVTPRLRPQGDPAACLKLKNAKVHAEESPTAP